MIKKFIISMTLLALMAMPGELFAKVKTLSIAHPPALATSPSGDITSGAEDWQAKFNAVKSANEDKKVTALKDLGQTLIKNRIELLTNLQNRVNKMSAVNEEDKTSLIAEISQNIVDLNTLKTRLEAETTVESLKNDIREIFETYKTYSIVAPRDLGKSLVYNGQFILGRLEAIQTKIQKLVDDQKNAGVDTTKLEASMKEVTNKLIDAESQLNIALEKFKSITPANTATAKTSRAEGKAAMKRAKDDLTSAHTLLKEIVEKLKALSVASPSPTSSSSISSSPTPTD